MRLDLYLVQNGFYSAREKAKKAISDGKVTVNNKTVNKPSYLIAEGDCINVFDEAERYVGRGGFKLEEALRAFAFSVVGITVVDLGASTGGFTDCLLQNGAKKVYAVDVGTNQLVDKLRTNPSVVVMEKTNARGLNAEFFEEEIQLVTADLSFISLRLVFPAIAAILPTEGCAICLVKPQFEAGRERIGKNGIVRDEKVHYDVLENLIEEAKKNNLMPFGLIPSPITGGDGNKEFLIGLKKNGELYEMNVGAVVSKARSDFEKGGN